MSVIDQGNRYPGLRPWYRMERTGTVTVLKLGGEWDIAGAPQLRAALSSSILSSSVEPSSEDRSAPDLSLDLSEVAFMDSSGFAPIDEAARLLAGGGGDLTIIACSRPVRRLLELLSSEELLA